MPKNAWEIVVRPKFRVKSCRGGGDSEIRLEIDCVFFHYLRRELQTSKIYCYNFVIKWKCERVRFVLLSPTNYDLIDYRWNDVVFQLVRERCELDHALSWLSTLGGAFSALGDYFENCAEIAGKISMEQLKLALRLQDPNVMSRCRLYFSLSLIQKSYFKEARRIIRNEFALAKCSPVPDERLIRMCQGIWAKLQYEHAISRQLIKNV